MQPLGPDSNITKLLANLLRSKHLYFIISTIVMCHIDSINVFIIIIIMITLIIIL